jgi:hypothetical protein
MHKIASKMDTTGLQNVWKEDTPQYWRHEVYNLQSSTANRNIPYSLCGHT